jgi:hypothetical protein
VAARDWAALWERSKERRAASPATHTVDVGDAKRLAPLIERALAARASAQESPTPKEPHLPPPEPVRSPSVEPGDLVLDHLLVAPRSRTAHAAADWQQQKDRDRFTEYGGHGSEERQRLVPDSV